MVSISSTTASINLSTNTQLFGDLETRYNKKLALVTNSTKSIKLLKFDNDIPNEFSNDYYIRLSEVIIIVFILILWILSLRKFFKNFDKIRTTHYREIPYKYRVKDPENLNKIRVCRYPSQGVIFTNDPVANVVNGRHYSLCHDLIMSPKHSLNRQMSPLYDEFELRKKKLNIVISEVEDNNQSDKTSRSSSNFNRDLYADIEYIDNNNINTKNSNERLIDSNNNFQTNSLSNLTKQTDKINLQKKLIRTKRQDDSYLDEQIYHRYSTDQRRHLFRNSEKNSNSSPKSFIDHLSVSPVIKKSIIDLHKRSLEKISRNSSGNSIMKSPSVNSAKRNSMYVYHTPSTTTKLKQLKSNKMTNIRYSDCSSLSKKYSFYNQSAESFL